LCGREEGGVRGERVVTWWEAEFGVLEIEVDDLGEGVDFCGFELSDELC
jgi:hypothetical protein